MIVSKAHGKYIRVSSRKVRLVVDLVRGEKVNRALTILANVNKMCKVYVEKVLNSAISNARINPAVQTDQLFISKIVADNGPMLKRYRAAAMGRAVMIRHRTTHLTIELSKHEVKQTRKTKQKDQTLPRRKVVKKQTKK